MPKSTAWIVTVKLKEGKGASALIATSRRPTDTMGRIARSATHRPALKKPCLPDHPLALVGAHQTAACADCHAQGQEFARVRLQQLPRPARRASAGQLRHLPQPSRLGRVDLVRYRLSPKLSHGLEGKSDCLMCHDLEGEIHAGAQQSRRLCRTSSVFSATNLDRSPTVNHP